MRVVDVNNNTITEYSEDLGSFCQTEIIVGENDDGTSVWETVLRYEPYTQEQLEIIAEQKKSQEEREEQAAQAAAYAEYFTALTSAFGGE